MTSRQVNSHLHAFSSSFPIFIISRHLHIILIDIRVCTCKTITVISRLFYLFSTSYSHHTLRLTEKKTRLFFPFRFKFPTTRIVHCQGRIIYLLLCTHSCVICDAWHDRRSIREKRVSRASESYLKGKEKTNNNRVNDYIKKYGT